MDRFTVVWAPDAKASLADIWMNCDDRTAVTVAADSIDSELALRPFEIGDPQREGLFRLERPPLVVHYVVRELDRTVEVGSVRRI